MLFWAIASSCAPSARSSAPSLIPSPISSSYLNYDPPFSSWPYRLSSLTTSLISPQLLSFSQHLIFIRHSCYYDYSQPASFSGQMGHYNTRRISLSLPSLGVQLPRAHRSAAAPASPGDSPPAKRIKRSHTLSGTPLSQSFTPAPPVLPRHATSLVERPLQSAITAAVNTPPPSPHPNSNGPKLDYEGINDDIVVGVLQQLEKTGNRPHLIKELATVLMTSLKVVETYVPLPA